MTRKSMAIASLIVMVTMVAVATMVAAGLPPDVPLPVHWGLNGQPDQFSSKWVALLMPLLIVAPTSLIFFVIAALEPRQEGLARSQGLYLSAWAGVLLLGGLVQMAIVSVALRWSVHGTSFILAGVGATFILIGNQLGKSRSMYMIGIRTPWTLASEDVWIRTHRLGGKLMVVGGLSLLIAAFLPLPSGMIATLLIGVSACAALAPIAYSYVLWRREQVMFSSPD